jgi:SAM-dependent methyltransferase
MPGSRSNEDLLAEQIEYYQARAPEYDRWFNREGRYDRGEEATRAWFTEIDEVRGVLARTALDRSDVLEFAPGTGLWTELLSRRARHVTAVDASSEMIAMSRRRLGRLVENLTFIKSDIFTWTPDRTFDAVVFCFWISHVPNSMLDRFLATVAKALRPGGSVFFVDGRKEPTSTAADHVLPADGDELMRRRLDDGREFTIVKNFWSPTELEGRFANAGLAVTIGQTEHFFQFGVGVRPD